MRRSKLLPLLQGVPLFAFRRKDWWIRPQTHDDVVPTRDREISEVANHSLAIVNFLQVVDLEDLHAPPDVTPRLQLIYCFLRI